MTLREVMHAHIPWLTLESTVRDAVDKMDIYQFPALVAVDPSMRPMAVVTEGDLCRNAFQRDSLIEMSNEPAYRLGTQDPTCVDPEMEIGAAFHMMLSSGLTVLPIVMDNRLIGIALRVDLMQAMLMDASIRA